MASPPFRHKVYVEGSQTGISVPFTEVVLGDGSPGVRLYDTSGPGSDPERGLQPLREGWITGRGDVEVGRRPRHQRTRCQATPR